MQFNNWEQGEPGNVTNEFSAGHQQEPHQWYVDHHVALREIVVVPDSSEVPQIHTGLEHFVSILRTIKECRFNRLICLTGLGTILLNTVGFSAACRGRK